MLAIQGSAFDSKWEDYKYGRNSAIYSAHGIEKQSRKSLSPKRRPRSKNSFSAASKDEVTIHVCDEGRRTSKYFFCQKKLLVQHMKYFERFLAENDDSHDLDISVHCDVEIFEWLMNYVHNPCLNPLLDLSILVSILISSDFLLMDSLVDICLENIAGRLQEFVKLPIDLSCISDKLVNKLAVLTHPKILLATIDRKDKILNRLYKRRVELDFSRRGGARSNPLAPRYNRAIAASLTCCTHCGKVYLECYVSSLSCEQSPPMIGFRGNLVRKHSSTTGWSLTTYLKSLHGSGMTWEGIYWHVWGACVVLQPALQTKNKNENKYIRNKNGAYDESDECMISASDVDRYTIESMGISVYSRSRKKISSTDCGMSPKIIIEENGNSAVMHSAVITPTSFSLLNEDDTRCNVQTAHMAVTPELLPPLKSTDSADGLSAYLFTPSLDPQRSPNVLPKEVFELLESQIRFNSTSLQKRLLTETARDTFSKSSQNISNTPTPSPSISSNSLSSSQEGADGLWNDTESRSRVRTNHTKSWGDKIGDPPRPSTASTGERNRDRDRQRELYQDNDRLRSRSKSAGRMTKQNGDKVSSNSSGLTSSAEFRSSHTAKGTDCVSDGNLLRSSNCTIPSYSLLNPAVEEAKDGDIDVKNPITRNLSIYEGIPFDTMRISEGDKAVMQSLRLAPHPLQLQSVAMMESLHAVHDWNKTGQVLSLEKQISWQLDLLRVHDGERMERYEAFLWSKRSPNIEDQLKARSLTLKGPTLTQRQSVPRRQRTVPVPVPEYYKDKGRQATK